MELQFYKQPFRMAKYSSWVYDADHNFVFQFENDYDERGEYLPEQVKLFEEIIFALNDVEHAPIPGVTLTVKDSIEIYHEDVHIITIRGWGNLTGVGAHNLSGDVASKIQDDFVQWLLWRANDNGTTPKEKRVLIVAEEEHDKEEVRKHIRRVAIAANPMSQLHLVDEKTHPITDTFKPSDGYPGAYLEWANFIDHSPRFLTHQGSRFIPNRKKKG